MTFLGWTKFTVPVTLGILRPTASTDCTVERLCFECFWCEASSPNNLRLGKILEYHVQLPEHCKCTQILVHGKGTAFLQVRLCVDDPETPSGFSNIQVQRLSGGSWNSSSSATAALGRSRVRQTMVTLTCRMCIIKGTVQTDSCLGKEDFVLES